MNTLVYRRLAEHLDSLPSGFPPATDGADLQLLAYLFDEREAALAPCLTLQTEPAAVIAARAGLPEAQVESLLREMAHKGLILSAQGSEGNPLYRAAPWVVGIYEFQVNNLTPELRRLLNAYWASRVARPEMESISQVRVVPVAESIEARLAVLPWENVEALLSAKQRFAVAPCICRRHARLEGGGCDAPEETCLMFDEWADYYVSTGRGRAIDRTELAAILKSANGHNLVLEPSNSQDIAFLCSCCGCCCGVLAGLKRQPRPADVVTNDFTAELDADACTGCLVCLERCQMEALVEADDGFVRLKAERCIGCGLCVSTCPSGALRLVRKTGRPTSQLPADLLDTWQTLRRQRLQGLQ